MLEVYAEVNYKVPGDEKTEAEWDLISDIVFDLDQASDNVFDTSPSLNLELNLVTFTCFAFGPTIADAVASAEELMTTAIDQSKITTWTWFSTEAYEPGRDYEVLLYCSKRPTH